MTRPAPHAEAAALVLEVITAFEVGGVASGGVNAVAVDEFVGPADRGAPTFEAVLGAGVMDGVRRLVSWDKLAVTDDSRHASHRRPPCLLGMKCFFVQESEISDRKPAGKRPLRGALTCSPLWLYRGRLMRSEGCIGFRPCHRNKAGIVISFLKPMPARFIRATSSLSPPKYRRNPKNRHPSISGPVISCLVDPPQPPGSD
jgi:hypothetical protein